MPSKTHTYDVSSLMDARFQSAAEFGLDTIAEVLQADLAAHNELVMGMLSDLCEISTDRQRVYGTSGNESELDEIDEYGRPRTTGSVTGAAVGFPMRKFGKALGWTSTWLKANTPADVATAVVGAQTGHLKSIRTQIRKAVFESTNFTYNDHLIDNYPLSVKRFLNADGDPIPDGPDQQVFVGATHTHYNATAAAVTDGELLALVDDVVEHGHGGGVRVVISRADEALIRSLPSFVAYQDPRLMLGANLNQAETRLDIARLDNRAIGLFGAAEVWVKSWGLANYAFCYDSADSRKPLVFRQREQSTLQGLMLVSEFDTHPLHAQYLEAEFGIGAWTRTNGSVLYLGGGGVYVDPVI